MSIPETQQQEAAKRADRFPLQPLMSAARVDSTVSLARAVGVSARTVHRWALTGLSTTAADRAAIAIGSHPASLWPRQWNENVAEEADVA